MLTDEDKEAIWKEHCEAFPKIKSWPEEKQETARKAYLAGYNNAFSGPMWCVYREKSKSNDVYVYDIGIFPKDINPEVTVNDIMFQGTKPDCRNWLKDSIAYVILNFNIEYEIIGFPAKPKEPLFSGTREQCQAFIDEKENQKTMYVEEWYDAPNFDQRFHISSINTCGAESGIVFEGTRAQCEMYIKGRETPRFCVYMKGNELDYTQHGTIEHPDETVGLFSGTEQECVRYIYLNTRVWFRMDTPFTAAYCYSMWKSDKDNKLKKKCNDFEEGVIWAWSQLYDELAKKFGYTNPSVLSIEGKLSNIKGYNVNKFIITEV